MENEIKENAAQQGNAEETQNEANSSQTIDNQSNQNELNAEIETLKKEADEYKDKYLRLYADFDNFRRRASKEKLDFLKTANEDLLLALLPVIDDFERAQKSLHATHEAAGIDAVKQGIDLIHSKFVKTLQNKGLKEIEDCKGKELDVEKHEAITQIPFPDLAGKVVDVLEKGYMLEDKVIRFAKVVVGA